MSSSRGRDPYYLRNFHRLADTVLARDGALFHADERARLDGIRDLGTDARRLLLRLVGRREGWLRQGNLCYQDVADTAMALDELAARDWIERWPEPGAVPSLAPGAELIDTLTHAEVRHLLGESRGPGRTLVDTDRRRLLCRLQATDSGETPLASQLGLWSDATPHERLARLDGWILLKHRGLFRRLELLFFGNRQQTLSQFVVTRLGHQRFERVTPDARGPFADREEAEALLAEGKATDALLEARTELQALLRGWRRGQPLPDALRRPLRDWLASAWIHARPAVLEAPRPQGDPLNGAAQRRRLRLHLLCAGASLLERLGRHGAAARWLRLALAGGLEGRRRDEAWQRLVLDRQHVGGKVAMQVAARQALDDGPGPLARLDLARRLDACPRLRQPETVRLEARSHPGHRGGRTLLRNAAGAATTVEDWTLDRLAADGWQGLHAENRLLRALAGLAAWELLFAPMPGAFLHRFQVAPRDWGRADFLVRRESVWRDLRARLMADTHREVIRERIARKSGRLNPLVDWSLFPNGSDGQSESSLSPWRFAFELLLEQVPGPTLAAFLERLLPAPSALGHGLPDLLQWRLDDTGRVFDWRMAEVKGPGDRLFDAQRLWIDWMLEHGLPVIVISVGN